MGKGTVTDSSRSNWNLKQKFRGFVLYFFSCILKAFSFIRSEKFIYLVFIIVFNISFHFNSTLLQCVGHDTGKGNAVWLRVNLQSSLSDVSNLHFLPIHQLCLPFFQLYWIPENCSWLLVLFATLCLCFFCKSCEWVLQSPWGCLCAHDTPWLATSGD